ncbi:tRNA (guanosine(46)-N7)-methyltransferase TrmB [Adhaeribacter pallidiroseus]|uniref:tRNA (guanine-N(7)-)-methyltransferase n=1 Tax=Adhaeribacter pallidiroseus TaxID=2072847 RepID=A0A369QLC7_9BACT|nr:tRNA (guanosine(46)-N7)-methyltransferase TrmB [Adhaeribacter pallidiroseus]RDC63068.1 tRNA (guanine(46)-N(7))-methyltransferase [Adhaeribacter pallidiroseus]
MARSKLAKFKEIAESDLVLEAGKPLFENIKGKWHESYFQNDYPIILEIGCGKGDYTIGMANLFPNKNFIGVDIKGSRIWKGSCLAQEQGLTNVAFLRNFIELLPEQFAPGEISEIWITFPDPRPRKGEEKKRLTSTRFLDIYESLLKPSSLIHFKTDDLALFEFTLDLLKMREAKNLRYTFDLYASDLQQNTLGIQTTYEKRFLAEGQTIKYLQYTR